MEDNLVTLCGRCHAQTNSNRSYWEMFLTGMKPYLMRNNREYLEKINKKGVILL
jgi:cytochrome c553